MEIKILDIFEVKDPCPKERIRELLMIKDRTIIELQTILQNEGYNVLGEKVILSKEVPFGVWWLGISASFRDAIFELLEEDYIRAEYTKKEKYTVHTPLNYLPIKKLADPKYNKKFSWTPILLISNEKENGLYSK